MYEYLPIMTVVLVVALIVSLFGLMLLKHSYTLEKEIFLGEMGSLEEKYKVVSLAQEESQGLLEQSRKEHQEETRRSIALDQKNAIYQERISGLNEKVINYEALQQEYHSLEALFEQTKLNLSTTLSSAQSRLSELEKYLTALQEETKNDREKNDRTLLELSAAHSRIKELETILANERVTGSEKLELLEKNKLQMKLEFKELADAILKNNSEHFSQQNSESLTKMILPIKEQFDAFKKQIHDVYVNETKERSMLQVQINHIKEINQQMSKEAKNLTNALKGESKTQGIWGEMILERVLENSGLKAGESYKREVSLEHESDNNRYRPDVIVYLPDKREIIIDAKTSLRAYEQYISTQEEHQKQRFADQHIASIRKHIGKLSDKDYTGLKGVETLDFIFMFVPVESALLMAMEHDSGLFDYAFKKNVILVGPTTLMVALRAVENTWKQEHQQRNAMEIAKRAGQLYDKFVGFIESVERLGKQIGTIQKTYDETFNKLHTGAGSLTNQFEKLKRLGAATSKRVPEHIARMIEE